MRVGIFLAAMLLAGPAQAEMEIVPVLGVNVPTGEGSDKLDPGWATGVSLGGRISDYVGLHGALVFGALNPSEDPPDGADVTTIEAVFSFAPRFHVLGRTGPVDVMVGPLLGLFVLSSSASANGTTVTLSSRGYHFGLQGGVSVPITDALSVGPIFSYSRLEATEVCVSIDGDEECDDVESDDDNDTGIIHALVALDIRL